MRATSHTASTSILQSSQLYQKTLSLLGSSQVHSYREPSQRTDKGVRLKRLFWVLYDRCWNYWNEKSGNVFTTAYITSLIRLSKAAWRKAYGCDFNVYYYTRAISRFDQSVLSWADVCCRQVIGGRSLLHSWDRLLRNDTAVAFMLKKLRKEEIVKQELPI